MYDFFEPLNKHILFPFYYWKSGDKRLARLRELEKNQYLPLDELKALQLKRLQHLVKIAYEHVPYYRRCFEQRNLTPADIQTLDDIRKLPVLTKQLIQDNLDDLISTNYDKSKLIEDASGGSTGQPTIFFKDLDRHRLRRADQIRHDRWSGWDLGKPFALIWGAQRDLPATRSWREFIIARYIDRYHILDAFEMSEQEMADFVVTLRKVKPVMLLGYANALYIFAKYLNEAQPDHGIRPEGIISSAETLSEEKRGEIEKAFECKVLNRYGSREVDLVASECKAQNGLHINADNVYVEVLSSEEEPVPPGELGDIVVTDFWNFGMPFIRYRLEDRGRLTSEPCSCGRTLPLMASVEGRVSDFLTAQDGTLVHGEYFTHLFYGEPAIRHFQIIQETREQVRLKLVLNQPLAPETFTHYETKIREMLGQGIELIVEEVEHIPQTATGKYLFTVSKVKT